jgi:hypothetical protein
MDLTPLPSSWISEEAAYCGPVPLPIPVTVISIVTMTAMVPMPSFSKRILEGAPFRIPAPPVQLCPGVYTPDSGPPSITVYQ